MNKIIDRERQKEEKSTTVAVIADMPIDKPHDSPLWLKRQAKKKQQEEKKAAAKTGSNSETIE